MNSKDNSFERTDFTGNSIDIIEIAILAVFLLEIIYLMITKPIKVNLLPYLIEQLGSE
jgi:hypothetical protein